MPCGPSHTAWPPDAARLMIATGVPDVDVPSRMTAVATAGEPADSPALQPINREGVDDVTWTSPVPLALEKLTAISPPPPSMASCSGAEARGRGPDPATGVTSVP